MFQGSVASLVSSSESGAGMSSISSCQSNSNLSIPFHNKPKLELRTHRSNMILSSSKFQVLSPISDKSQEQSSEQGDSSSRTPKVSPTDHILASCCGVNSNNDDTENNNQVRSIKSKDFFLSNVYTLWVSRILKYPKKCLEDLTMFFMSTWWGDPKIWKKLNSHDGFLSYLQNSTANSAHLAAHFCPALDCPQKATMRIQFLPYFWNPLIK